MPRRVSILGCTGSIGRSACDVIRHYAGRFEVVALSAHSNVELLKAQIDEFRPSFVAVSDEKAGARLRQEGVSVPLEVGPQALISAAQKPADAVLCAMVGAAGLPPIVAAIDAGNNVAIANKEPVVMAGRLIMERARARGVEVLPVDSEHNAIFQCLHGHKLEDVRCIHLTASGGPFYGKPRDSLVRVTPDQAAKHPTWDMGRKISVDSATLMNKGLEVIEAMWLFGLPLSKIEVIIHPQSIVHSLVEFNDGSILGHLGITDMKFPILFALTWPERVESPMGRLNLARMRELTFATPSFDDFPCLALALRAAKTGGTAPAVLNAANEEAVSAFCNRRIAFLQIDEVVSGVMETVKPVADVDLETVVRADAEARREARRQIETKLAN